MRSSGLHGKDGLTLRIQTPRRMRDDEMNSGLTENTPREEASGNREFPSCGAVVLGLDRLEKRWPAAFRNYGAD